MSNINLPLIERFTKTELESAINQCNSYRETLRKLGYNTYSGEMSKCLKIICKELGISTDHFTKRHIDMPKRTPENTFIEHSSASQSALKKLYKKGNYSEYKCAICGQEPFWNGSELVLTLDHINGENHDNRLENLRWVCPNCNRQLDTYGGRNKREHKKVNHCSKCGKEISENAKMCTECYNVYKTIDCKPSCDELLMLLNEHKNFTKVGELFGVSSNAVVKWCKGYGLKHHISDYKNTKQKLPKKQKTQAKAVHMLSIETNEIIRTFDSMYEASKYLEVPFAYNHIANVCNGKRKTAYGYRWKFADT